MFQIRLRSVGNPDFGQYASVSEPEVVRVNTIEEAQKAARDYIEKWDLGGGNWVEPEVKSGKMVLGHISYNGRYWPVQ